MQKDNPWSCCRSPTTQRRPVEQTCSRQSPTAQGDPWKRHAPEMQDAIKKACKNEKDDERGSTSMTTCKEKLLKTNLGCPQTGSLEGGGLEWGVSFQPLFFQPFWFQPSEEGFSPPPTPALKCPPLKKKWGD